MFYAHPESQLQTIQPAVLLQDHLFVLVFIEAALGKEKEERDENVDVQSSFCENNLDQKK